MINIFDYPVLVLVLALTVQWLGLWAGGRLRQRWKRPDSVDGPDFGTVLSAELTLLALVIGFTFAMAVSRYDLRKHSEEVEANAIGTEYLRLDFLPPAESAQAKGLLVSYLGQRILSYRTRDPGALARIDVVTERLQHDLWSAIVPPAQASPDALRGIVASGMNEVIDSQGFAQAAVWNRIPLGAWGLVLIIAAACNLLLGLSRRQASSRVVFALPLIVSMSVFLVADIDCPRGGVIWVLPQNLIALSQSMAPR